MLSVCETKREHVHPRQPCRQLRTASRGAGNIPGPYDRGGKQSALKTYTNVTFLQTNTPRARKREPGTGLHDRAIQYMLRSRSVWAANCNRIQKTSKTESLLPTPSLLTLQKEFFFSRSFLLANSHLMGIFKCSSTSLLATGFTQQSKSGRPRLGSFPQNSNRSRRTKLVSPASMLANLA